MEKARKELARRLLKGRTRRDITLQAGYGFAAIDADGYTLYVLDGPDAELIAEAPALLEEYDAYVRELEKKVTESLWVVQGFTVYLSSKAPPNESYAKEIQDWLDNALADANED